MEPAVILPRFPQVITPVRFPKRRVRHVGGRRLIGGAGGFRPARALRWPVIVREVIVGVVVEALEILILGRCGRRTAEPQGHSKRRNTGGTNQAAKHGVSSLTKWELFPGIHLLPS